MSETPEQTRCNCRSTTLSTTRLLAHALLSGLERGPAAEGRPAGVREAVLWVLAFPVSAVRGQCDDLEARQLLLENLVEEEQGPDNHPELIRFAEASARGPAGSSSRPSSLRTGNRRLRLRQHRPERRLG